MALVRVQDRIHFFTADSVELKVVGAGRWDGVVNGFRRFHIVGGRKSGGASNEWFVSCRTLFGDEWIPTRSMVECIRHVVNG